MANKKEVRGEERGRRKERGSERSKKDETSRGRTDRQRKQEAGEQMIRKECRGKEERQKERKNKGKRSENANMKQGGKGRPNVYNQWKEDRMIGALEEYKEALEKGAKVSVNHLSRAWGVPRATLQRRVRGEVSGGQHSSGRKPYLPEEAERELVAILKTLAQRGFPLTKRTVQQVAFDYAAKYRASQR
ncbi:hypothetical protein ACEWY4_007688 [Coilia grayii]|uniref:HTH psq-type domain-containing protein n=1 Tax=Coilia grayii TaxID=363190 RepID=A0ABD1K8R9_9TELE